MPTWLQGSSRPKSWFVNSKAAMRRKNSVHVVPCREDCLTLISAGNDYR